jgi:hypothetical protein
MMCQLCHQDGEWHRTHHPKHAFVGPDDDPVLIEALVQSPPPSNSMRGDPVLRLALVKAGLLLDEQIFEAEVWVREAASAGGAVVVENGEFKLLSVDEWISRVAAR